VLAGRWAARPPRRARIGAPSSAPPPPPALAGRRCGNNRTIDERHAPMDAYGKTTSFDSKLGATITETRFLKSCSKASCPHPGVRHARSTSLAVRGTSFSGTVGHPSMQSRERVLFLPTIALRRRTTVALGRPVSPLSPRRNLVQVHIPCGTADRRSKLRSLKVGARPAESLPESSPRPCARPLLPVPSPTRRRPTARSAMHSV
jgi:hypothetical protein